MIGIEQIAYYIPDNLIDNTVKSYQGSKVDDSFVVNKIGFTKVARKGEAESVADMCERAFSKLSVDKSDIDCVCLCTQNGDYHIPHTSAVLQHRLGLRANVAAFDISLGCSGYVYALSLFKAFMEANEYKKGVLFTCDPYSKVIDASDKNTDLLFGDAASVTLLGGDPFFDIGKIAVYTDGANYNALIQEGLESLFMDGRRIFNFAVKYVPQVGIQAIKVNGFADYGDMDLVLLHQASKYIVDNLIRRMKIDEGKVPFIAEEYGNTVSSSVPIALAQYLLQSEKKNIMLVGFGVGLSIAAIVIRRKGDK